MRIEIVAFDGLDELDAVLPYEVLSNAAQAHPDWEVALVGVDGPGRVVGSHGLRIEVDAGLENPDVIVVPGGGWGNRAPRGAWQQAQDGHLPDRLRELAPTCEWVASVCTGAMLLAAAGLTKGRPATTHHVAHEDLRQSGADVMADHRVVDDGNLITCGGITSGLDLALWLIERELGADLAATVAREMEHERVGRIWQRSS
jgi:transcriptional regulator GlxA family with amidase domain